MVKVSVKIWKINCLSAREFGLGTCNCISHPPVVEEDLTDLPRIDIPDGQYDAFINHYNEEMMISIPLRFMTNLYGERIASEELRIKLLNK
jgi:hypothetical protein